MAAVCVLHETACTACQGHDGEVTHESSAGMVWMAQPRRAFPSLARWSIASLSLISHTVSLAG